MTAIALTPRKLPRQERSRALFDAILDAAARILAQHGRDALNTNLVAEKAGVSIGSLYQYFPNREAIIASVASRHFHRMYHHVAVPGPKTDATLEAAIARIAQSLFAAHRIDPALHAVLDGDLPHSHEADHDHHHVGTKDAMIEQIRNLPPQASSEIRRSDIELAALTVTELVHAMAHAAIVHPHSEHDTADFEREAVRAAVAYLRTPD
jgi:AcrR family transcriptional regulator